jgi:hypothetical protein
MSSPYRLEIPTGCGRRVGRGRAAATYRRPRRGTKEGRDGDRVSVGRAVRLARHRHGVGLPVGRRARRARGARGERRDQAAPAQPARRDRAARADDPAARPAGDRGGDPAAAHPRVPRRGEGDERRRRRRRRRARAVRGGRLRDRGARRGWRDRGRRRRPARRRRQRLRARAPARPPRRARPRPRVLHLRQHRAGGDARPRGARGRAGGDRRLGRPPRQRHRARLLRRRQRADDLAAPGQPLPGRLRRRRGHGGGGRRGGEHQHPAAARLGQRGLRGGDRARGRAGDPGLPPRRRPGGQRLRREHARPVRDHDGTASATRG